MNLATKLFGALLLALSSAIPLQAQPVTLKLGTLAPEGSAFDLIIRDMGEKWKENGVDLVIYPGGVLGDEPDMVRKMAFNQIQAGVLTVVGLSQLDDGVQALSIPMLYRNDAESDYVRERMEPVLAKRLEAKGYKVLNWGSAGWVMFFGKTPVLTPDDLRKMKFFIWGDDHDTSSIWKSAGFSPVPLAVSDIMPNLQTGLINCFDTTPISALSFQWFALAPHMTDLKWAPLVGATIMTTKAWNKIPAEARPAVLKAAQEAGTRFRNEIRSKEEEAVNEMVKRGLKIHKVTPQQYQEWEDLFTGIYPKISGKVIPADMMDLAIKYRDEYRALKAGGK